MNNILFNSKTNEYLSIEQAKGKNLADFVIVEVIMPESKESKNGTVETESTKLDLKNELKGLSDEGWKESIYRDDLNGKYLRELKIKILSIKEVPYNKYSIQFKVLNDTNLKGIIFNFVGTCNNASLLKLKHSNNDVIETAFFLVKETIIETKNFHEIITLKKITGYNVTQFSTKKRGRYSN